VARIISFVVLFVILLATTFLFFRVMADFLLPLFLATLLVVMFGPLHRWFRGKCRGHDRIAAMLTTSSILLMVLIPLLLIMVEAAYDAQIIYREAVGGSALSEALLPGEETETNAQEFAPPNMQSLTDWATGKVKELGEQLGMKLNTENLKTSFNDGAQRFLAPLALRTTRFFGQMVIGFCIMLLATYYFFADGPVMIQALLRLTPLEGNRTQELLDQFDSVTRAVVVATLLSAFIQGILAGLGFYFADVGSVFLLTALCMLFTMVPFVGAAIIWVPVCLWLFAIEGRTMAAVLLAVYCIGVVSMVDNLIKPMVLHGRSNLHPLLALLSVLGGVQALGPIGIFVGPMVVAFLQTLLNMVNTELKGFSQPSAAPAGIEPA